jgi:glyceraldehyde 3-phosphate dehydrogenase
MTRLLINGAAGRIGRGVTREVTNLMMARTNNRNGPYLIALNDLVSIDDLVEIYASRDPVHGIYDWRVEKISENTLTINGLPFRYTREKNISGVLKDNGIEMVLECSGFFGDPKVKDPSIKLGPKDNLARGFLDAGVRTVIQTYPAKTADINMIMGVNHEAYDSEKHKIISNASCTTKALSVPLQVLLDNGINVEVLSMDTTHAATASQKTLESVSQIVTHATGAAKATGLVIPSLKGKMAGMSYRVPTLDGSFANLYFVATSDDELTTERINDLIRKNVSNPKYEGRLGVFEGEDAGTFDIVGRRENAVVIPSKTVVLPLSFAPEGKKASLVTLISGYDNELGSSVDPVLLADYVARKG